MRVVHMDSGLGNQMLDYAEYLAIQEVNTDEVCYLETIIYSLPHVPGMFSQWNGYELERVFGIQALNVKDLFSTEQWGRILKRVEESRFWEEDWNYAPYIVEAFEKEGLELQSFILDKRSYCNEANSLKIIIRKELTKFFRTRLGYHLKRFIRKVFRKKLIQQKNSEIDVYKKYPSNVYIGHSLAFRYKGFGLERIDEKIREAFKFPPITDDKNLKILELIHSTNSVAVHARRSDLLFVNGDCYKYGYFKRSIKYIRKKVKDPVFIFFCDEKSTGWCEENEAIFGLDFKVDKVYFVDWNKGEESFRDMQLMAECKHNIFTQSSFGFWGAYLNTNPDKITCAPDLLFLATHTF